MCYWPPQQGQQAAAGAAAAGAGALTAGAAWVAVELEPNVAPQLGQAVASSAASV